MIMTKLFFILSIILVGLIACLRIAGVISDDIAQDTLGRSLGIVTVLFIVVTLASFAAGKKKSPPSQSEPPNSGPKF